MLERVLIEVRGAVQGVGFRPFVHSLATSLDVRGAVWNRGAHVCIDAEGESEAIHVFRARLVESAPPRASIEHVDVRPAAVVHRRGFAIAPSQTRDESDVRVAADIATCDTCLLELFDPANRRYRYPFINCSWCGPRYTIATGVPYDRTRTTMAGFTMCEACRREYENPRDRRFHAEPIACAACGPSLATRHRSGVAASGEAALAIAGSVLRAGGTLAVKGLGGYHLACDATNDAAIATLRARKRREGKPLAIMARKRDVRALQAMPALWDALTSPERPIVLVDRHAWRTAVEPGVSPAVAPGCPAVGVMLPYTPLHHLLLHEGGRPLVMTSGNASDDPIAFDDEEALTRLGEIADLFLVHDRPIHIRCDDSIVSIVNGAPAVQRRARGYAPGAIALAEHAPLAILATGGHLKNAFCIVEGSRAYPSPHVGDLESFAAYEALSYGIAHYRRLLGIDPQVVAHDLHPEYLSTRFAREMAARHHVAVQHHHAHVLSCAAERGTSEPVIGVAFDGAGLGTDGAVWGGEFLVVEGTGCRRAAHLSYVAQPGGDRAAREPWRMAVAHAMAAGRACDAALEAIARRIPSDAFAVVRRAAGQGTGLATSSVGRLFDAVAALIGVRDRCAFEGQAAMELEALAGGPGPDRYTFDLSTRADPWTIDAAPLIRALVCDVAAGFPSPAIAAAFHQGVAAMIGDVAARIAQQTGIRRVALTGGVFQNALLTDRAARALSSAGLDVLLHRRVPCNDGGLALGQAIAAARIVRAGLMEEHQACA